MATPCNCDTFTSPVTIDAATAGPQLVVQGGTTGILRVFPGSGSTTGSIEAFASGDPSLATAWTRLRLTVDGTTAWIIADTGNGGAAMPIAFQAGGAERMRITTAGNVGIGTTSPAELLHLYEGSVMLQSNIINPITGGNSSLTLATDGYGDALLTYGTASTGAFLVQVTILELLVELAGFPKIPAQAVSLVAATPFNFIGNKMWSFRLG